MVDVITTPEICILSSSVDLKPNIQTLACGRPMLVVPEPLKMENTINRPTIRTPLNSDLGLVIYTDNNTGIKLPYDNRPEAQNTSNSDGSTNTSSGMIAHTISPSRDYTISKGDNAGLFETSRD
jgi:hypothetical protein